VREDDRHRHKPRAAPTPARLAGDAQEAHSLSAYVVDTTTDTPRHDHGDGLHQDLVKLATRRDALRTRPRRSRCRRRRAGVYAIRGYSGSLANLARTSLSADMVFGDDGAIHQLATVTGSVRKGVVANLTIGI
jgi:hypothetical protein